MFLTKCNDLHLLRFTMQKTISQKDTAQRTITLSFTQIWYTILKCLETLCRKRKCIENYYSERHCVENYYAIFYKDRQIYLLMYLNCCFTRIEKLYWIYLTIYNNLYSQRDTVQRNTQQRDSAKRTIRLSFTQTDRFIC